MDDLAATSPSFLTVSVTFNFEPRAAVAGGLPMATSTRFGPVTSTVPAAAVQLLAQHPEIGPVWRYGNPNHPTRYVLVPGFHNHLIFYRHESGEVRLGRLLHGAQDLGDVLGD